MNIVLTGATGFVGSHMVEEWQDWDIQRISLRDTDPMSVDMSGADSVVHCAALAHQTAKIGDSEYFRVNRDLTVRLAQNAKARGVKQFVFLSSTKVYGEGHADWTINENTPCTPKDSYGQSKYDAENSLKEMSDDNFKVCIIRPPLMYGKNVKGNLNKIMKLCDSRLPLPFRNIANDRAMVYVRNLTAFVKHCVLNTVDGTFLINSNTTVSTALLVKEIKKNLGRKDSLLPMPTLMCKLLFKVKPNLYKRLFGSFKIDAVNSLKTVNFVLPYTFEQGISEMVESYKSNKIR
jgi:nucleoside-diphosphate-sugar epimerase